MTYKVGDYLTIIGRICGHNFEIGEVVQVIKVTTYSYRARSTTRRGHEWALSSSEVEPFEPKGVTNRTYAKMVLED